MFEVQVCWLKWRAKTVNENKNFLLLKLLESEIKRKALFYATKYKEFIKCPSNPNFL